MKIAIESTTKITYVNPRNGDRAESGLACRVWEGVTESGIKVTCLIPRIAAHKDQDLSQFEKELTECKPPELENVFPLRMII